MDWLDRALVVSPLYYGLCVSEKDFYRELRKLKLPKDEWPRFLLTKHANATTHFFETNGAGRCAIVTLGNTKGRSKPQIFAMLTHEAVHIWQEVRESLGEKFPSSEFEAYSVQTLSQRLMEAYERSKK